jgi:hypothetical protein
MKIIVLSCSKNEDTFLPFCHFMERYYPEHPEVIYFTDGIINPFYKTIAVKNELATWTKGFREFLNQIEDDYVLLMIDDCFIRKPVDRAKIEFAEVIIGREENVACMNFEKSWDKNDVYTEYVGWKKRQHGSEYEVSLMCGIWDRKKLLHVVDRDCNPWTIELQQDGKGYDYYINSGDYIIDWGYETFKPFGKVKGVWTEEAKRFLESEGYHVGIKR